MILDLQSQSFKSVSTSNIRLDLSNLNYKEMILTDSGVNHVPLNLSMEETVIEDFASEKIFFFGETRNDSYIFPFLIIFLKYNPLINVNRVGVWNKFYSEKNN